MNVRMRGVPSWAARRRGRLSMLVVPVLAAGFGVLTAPVARADVAVVEAEHGAIDNPGCGDDGPMAVENHPEGSGGKIVFHPGTYCSQTFPAPAGLVGLDSIRYFTTGYVGVHCGHFEVTGAVTGESDSICASGGAWIVATFRTATGSGTSYTIRWRTSGDTPGWVNAFPDFHTRTTSARPQCSDGVDNDGDGVTDYPNDPGCASTSDPTESTPQCGDGRDNDFDNRIDHPADPGCTSLTDTSEGPDPQCSDRLDNDGDTATDYPDDAGCSSPSDNSENTPQCADGRDNDLDGRTDYPADPACWAASVDREAPDPECGDGIDNDGDGRTDYPSDPQCSGAADPTERAPQCSNGGDDDGDLRVDYPDDPGCSSASDDSEIDPPPPPEPPPACSDGRDNDDDGRVDTSDPGCTNPADESEQDAGDLYSPPRLLGAPCGLHETDDPAPDASDDVRLGVLFAGPFLARGPGTLTCTVQVNEGHHSSSSGAWQESWQEVIWAGDAVGVPDPRSITFSADRNDFIYVCTSWQTTRATWYWSPGTAGPDAVPGTLDDTPPGWTHDWNTPCADVARWDVQHPLMEIVREIAKDTVESTDTRDVCAALQVTYATGLYHPYRAYQAYYVYVDDDGDVYVDDDGNGWIQYDERWLDCPPLGVRPWDDPLA